MSKSDVRTLREVLDEFEARKNEDAVTDGATTGSRYVQDVEKWRDWLADDGQTVFDADYYDLTAYLKELKRDGYAVSTLKSRAAAISKFYQLLDKLDGNDRWNLPKEVPETPYE
jgi:site-specific recombinase XerD